MTTSLADPGLIVLDTNAVLDWLVFEDPAILPLARAVETAGVRWIACARMRAELAGTLLKPALARWPVDPAAVMAAFDRHAGLCSTPPPSNTLRCDDEADQVFVDLAVAQGAGWLLSHDRAVLRLRKRAAAQGLRIARPADWQSA